MVRLSRNPYRLLRSTSKPIFLAVLLASAGTVHAEDGEPLAHPNAQGDRIARLDAMNLSTSSNAGSTEMGMNLILSVTVNGVDRGLAAFRMSDGMLWANQSTIAELGLRVPPGFADESSMIPLTDMGFGDYRYNPNTQSLQLMVDSRRLAIATSRLNVVDQAQRVADTTTGALINYDAIVSIDDSRLAFDGFAELRLFSGTGRIENTMLYRGSRANSAFTSEAIRLDSSIAYSFPSNRLTVRAGDIVTRSASWSRPTRMGGLRVGTDFGLQPYLVTAPTPSFFGEATLPSTVDLYIDGLKRYSGKTGPGPFELGSGLNRINGSGRAEVVITDVLGQVTTLAYPLYDTPMLLREGLADWSAEIGAVRKRYGLRSFSYDANLALSASLRRGMSDTFTVEAHAEGTSDLANAGLGAAWLLPFGGVFSGSIAASQHAGKIGKRFEIGYSWIDSRFNLAATVQRADGQFSDLPSVNGTPVLLARDILTLGYNTKTVGAISAGVLRQRSKDADTRSYATFGWFASLGESVSLNASASQNLEDQSERSLFLTLSFTPNTRDHVSTSLQSTDRRSSAAVSYRRSVPLSGGTGWAFDASHGNDRFQSAVQVDHLGSHGQLTGGGRLIDGHGSAYAGYSGAMVLMGGDLFASRKVYDGFAVVSTDGVADVPVTLNNRIVGQTNKNGKLLVAGLNSFQRNDIGIDPEALPYWIEVPRVSQEAVPATRSGSEVRFSFETHRSLLVSLVDDGGKFLPVGATARVAGDEQVSIVGYDGQLYIEDFADGESIEVDAPEGVCVVPLPFMQRTEHGMIRLGQQICRKPS